MGCTFTCRMCETPVIDRSQQLLRWNRIAIKTSNPHTCLASQLEKYPLKPQAVTSSSFLQMFSIPTHKNTFFYRCGQVLFLSWDTGEDVTLSGMLQQFGHRETGERLGHCGQWAAFKLRLGAEMAQISLADLIVNAILVLKSSWKVI